MKSSTAQAKPGDTELYPIIVDGDLFPMRAEQWRPVADVLADAGVSANTHDLLAVMAGGITRACVGKVYVERGRSYITARKRTQ